MGTKTEAISHSGANSVRPLERPQDWIKLQFLMTGKRIGLKQLVSLKFLPLAAQRCQ